MTTLVTFYTEPTNIDYLMTDVRMQYGDLDGTQFSDTIIRTSLVSAIRYLQRSWNGKYQVYREENKLIPQPADVPAGYIRINSLYGIADIPDTTVPGSVFRDPYATFTYFAPPLLESIDEQAVILAAKYILRSAQTSSNAGDFVAWGTEDIRYNNLGAERGLSKLLENDLKALNDYIRTKIARPKRSEFPITYIPMLTELQF
jgi:hypothetical protein